MIVQGSCKFTSSVLSYLDKMGLPNGRLFEFFDYPEEFLRDSHSWLSLSDTEKFFQIAASISQDAQIARHCGLAVPELQSWGALDNVFKMMGEETKSYYAKLDRFFSYFLAPISDFKVSKEDANSVTFVFPFEKTLFPHISSFLLAILEVLPRYVGKPSAQVETLENGLVRVNWESQQASLFGDEEASRVMSPKLVDQMSKLLEQSERQIEELKLQNQRLQAQLRDQVTQEVFAEKLSGLAILASGVAHEINNPLSFVMSNLSRFKEYFANLQKYIEDAGLLNSRDLQKKYDVDFILKETPLMLEESLQGLHRLKETVKDLSSLAHPEEGKRVRKTIASSGAYINKQQQLEN